MIRCASAYHGATNWRPIGKPAFERFKPFFCYVQVEGELLTIVKQTGSQRPAGRHVGGVVGVDGQDGLQVAFADGLHPLLVTLGDRRDGVGVLAHEISM